jgi:hypothetical protein
MALAPDKSHLLMKVKTQDVAALSTDLSHVVPAVDFGFQQQVALVLKGEDEWFLLADRHLG